MKIDRIVVGSLFTNCYILSIGNNCIVIDPGDDYFKIKSAIGDKKVNGVIITHRHFDHIGALKYFKNIYDKNNLKEGINSIDNFKFEVIYTPGHTDDSICIYFKDNNITFDIIFLDPPYHLNLLNDALKYIEKYNLLKNDGLIICEYEEEVPLDIYDVIAIKKYGKTNIKVLRK